MIVLSLLGCGTAVHLASPGGFGPYVPITDGQVVSVTVARKSAPLGFNKDTYYVDEAWDGLLTRCQDGALTGVTVEFTTSLGFFTWDDRVTMRGLCVRG